MSDIETLHKAFAQAVTTGTSTVLISMPRRAGKSTLMKNINEHINSTKPLPVWGEDVEIQGQPIIDECHRDLMERYSTQDRLVRSAWYDPVKPLQGMTQQESEVIKRVFDESMKDTLSK